MFPILFRIGTFEVTSFGVMVAVGALVGLTLTRSQLRRRGLPSDAENAVVAGLLGGMLGAKLLWVFEHSDEAPLLQLLTDRGGLSWFGGLAGGAAAGISVAMARGWSLIDLFAASTPGLAAGQALGRVGCFLVGDDYGRPSTVPWAIAFPQGLPPTLERVHPTQLYEAAILGVLTWLLLRWSRSNWSSPSLVAGYLVIAGVERFLIELLRVNAVVAWGMSMGQLASILAVGVGAAVVWRGRLDPVRGAKSGTA